MMNTGYFNFREYGDNSSGWISSSFADKSGEENEKGEFVSGNIKVTSKNETYGKLNRIKNCYANISDKPVMLKFASSGYIKNIGEGGMLPWYSAERYAVYYCRMTWQGEFQWKKAALSELGLYRASNHVCANFISFSSVGSQNTSKYYPLVFIEDKELKKTWFFEIEAAANWYIEIGVKADGLLYAELNSAFANNDGWFKKLKSGESYEAEPCLFGTADGGFENAVCALYGYKRKKYAAKIDVMPVCFNDYMNCLWAMPSDEKLIPLINKAAELGCEIFCIDAGWYGSIETGWSGGLGDWEPCNERFGKYGLSGIIDYIKSKNMKPGVWLEIESVTDNNNAYKELSDCILRLGGEESGGSGRYIFDFRFSKTKEHFMGVFEILYNMGIRYIKNDYNQTSDYGADGKGAAAEELKESQKAFYGFIDSVRERFPDLIIENCASGAMRAGGAIMQHFHLMSVSDQEYYFNNPSLASGALACILPEKCGIWAYPYPVLDGEKNESLSGAFKDRKIKAAENGEETVFNMINAMFGIFYLSGHIELADKKNTALIKEAVRLYKQNRDFLKSAVPVYPKGFMGIYENGFYCFGFKGEEKIILAVWKINADKNEETFDLSAYAGENKKAELIYPKNLPSEFSFECGKLKVSLENSCCARLFEIKL